VTPQGEYRYSQANHSGLETDDVAITEIWKGRFTLTDWSKERLVQLISREHP
jgi:branched-chain amino acid transport system substrate-binding protein